MNNNMMATLMQMMGMGNPQQALQMFTRNNPQAQSALNQMNAMVNQGRQNGMNIEQVARQLARQQGIDIDQLLGFMRQRGMKP